MRHIIFPGSPDLLQLFPFNVTELKYILENPYSSIGKESTCYAGDPVSVARSGRSAGGQATPSSILGLPWWLSW